MPRPGVHERGPTGTKSFHALRRRRNRPRLGLIRSEAQEGGDVPDSVELGIVLHVEQLNVTANGHRNHGLANVLEIPGRFPARRTVRNHVRIDVSAASTFNSTGRVVLAQEQRLHFPQFQRAQNSAQTGDTPSVALGLAQGVTNQLVTPAIVIFHENAVGVLADLIERQGGNIGRKVPQHPLPHIRMELRLELRPVRVVTANDQFFPQTALEFSLQAVGYLPVMLTGLVGHVPFDVAGVVSCVAIGARARQGAGHVGAFPEFIEPQIEKTPALAVDHHHRKLGLRTKQSSKRLQVETTIDEQLRSRKKRRQIELTPDPAPAGSEHHLGAGLVSAQIAGEFKNSV